MLRVSPIVRLASKPITQGYISQFPAHARSSRLSSAYRRAADAHRGTILPFTGEVATSRRFLDEGEAQTVLEEQQEMYDKWYQETYAVEDLESTAASGPSNKALAAGGGDERNMAAAMEVNEQLAQQEVLLWEASFSHLENVK